MKLSLRRLFSAALVAVAVGGSAAPGRAFAQTSSGPAPSPQAADGDPSAPPAPPPPHAATPVVVGGGIAAPKDKPSAEPESEAERKEKPSPFRGSVFIFDQSMSTATARLETDPQQSFVPLYVWWLSFRPRYSFTDKFSYMLRVDYFKEWTNNSNTTQYRQDLFGDVWNTFAYGTQLAKEGPWKRTRFGASVNVLLPTSLPSQARGTYFTFSTGTSLRQSIPLATEATFFPSMNAGLSVFYSHPFTRSRTADGIDVPVPRQDLNGRPVLGNDLTGGMLQNHRVLVSADTGFAITEKLHLNLSMLLINGWNYAPRSGVDVSTVTGPTPVRRSSDATVFTQSTWFNSSIDYEVLDELTLALGYYNLAGVLASNGERRGVFGGQNVWWSPDARVFLTAIANLDAIYHSLTGSTPTGKPAEKTNTRQTTRNTMVPAILGY